MGRRRKEEETSILPEKTDIIENPINDGQYYRGDKNVPKSEAQFEWTPKMVQELKKCKEDILYFAENYFYIVNLDRGKEVIKLYTRQKQILRSLINNRFTVLLSCRQFGKTTLMTIYALWLACFESDQRIVIVANREQTAINVFKRVRTAYEQLPNFLKPGVKDYGKTGLTFDNDSSSVVIAADPVFFNHAKAFGADLITPRVATTTKSSTLYSPFLVMAFHPPTVTNSILSAFGISDTDPILPTYATLFKFSIFIYFQILFLLNLFLLLIFQVL